MQLLSDTQFWLSLGQVVFINVVLSADNAIVIALAARALPTHQQKQAVLIGTGVVIALRIALTLLAAQLLQWPFLKIIGALLLLWIAVKLLRSDDSGDPVESSGHLISAIKTILIADAVMSLDNVIAVAAAGQGRAAVIIAGLLLSIPLVVFCAALLMKLIDRWPVIVAIGAALLGWVAGDILISDAVWSNWITTQLPWLRAQAGFVFGFNLAFNWAQVAGAALVLIAGKCWMAKTGASSQSRG